MSEAPRYKHIPQKTKSSEENTEVLKKEIEVYKKKIEEKLKDADNIKKAALIISKLLSEKPSNQK